MADVGFSQVRASLARVLEASQTAGSSEQRAKLEELTRDLVNSIREMEKKLYMLPGAGSDYKLQQTELQKLRQMLKNADSLMLNMPSVYQTIDSEMGEI